MQNMSETKLSYEELRQENVILKEQNDYLAEQLDYFKRVIFGQKRERFVPYPLGELHL